MTDTTGVGVISQDTVIQGKILNGRKVVVHGYVEGTISSDLVIVAAGGRAYGNVRAVNVEVHGEVQGDVRTRELISIGETGVVAGKVQYGSIALAPGGELSADVRNVPPTLAGDMTLEVRRGRSVVITREDLQAFDPDDTASALTFSVPDIQGGIIALTSAPTIPVSRFSQADINARAVMFVHDGSDQPIASFQVSVSDAEGASSGAPQKVTIHVSE